MNRVDLKLCLLLAVCVSSVLSCRWTSQTQRSQSKFRHHHGISLDLIRTMGEKIHNDHEDINPIPYELINNHRRAEPEKQILFVIQALVEITGLFDDAVVPWDAKKCDDFLNIVHSQIDGLRSCGVYKMKRNKKLHLYFERLRHMTELNKEDGGKSWEIVRKRVISLLNQLESFPFNTQAH
ncbi:interferon phi 4 [Rhinichthys klamathensis goyatoka]|uniref:interferon phi 4 n=1 Tax=Rhinichthys klamathensis goyatoka TaxID=3034132 RepID=UPI0024B514F9|nr:interferon phi 4 [Rhinichthys klamathensis goyatoka]